MISRDTIEEVKNRVDIIDVISDFVTLKKSGQNYRALSPFTNEKTPSFFVVPAKGIFKDFSSGKGGDAFTFLMEHEGMTYVEAIRHLAKKYGVQIQEDQVSEEFRAEQSEREGLYILMNFAKEYYRNILSTTEEGRGIGLSYFRERGFNDRTLEKFELGYALNGWEKFSDEAIKKGYNKELLVKTGLAVKKDDGSSYDRFRGRVIFPVHNISGKIIAFGARMLGKEPNQPKYINSPETEIYHKGQVLYGLYQAKNAIRQHDNCFLVEGYTDIISMHQADVENVVASSGTALTEDQIKLIRRFTENVTVLFDGDTAGIKAALRGIDLILKGGLNVRVALFPDGEDPDSYSRKVGTTEFQKFLKENTKDFISFKADLYTSEIIANPIRKAEVIQDLIRSVANIPDHIKRTIYIQETSKKMDVPLSILNSEVNKILINERIKKKQELSKPNNSEPETGLSLSDIHELSKSFLYDPLVNLERFEKEFLKVLINFGMNKLESGEYVYQYLFFETQDVEFTNKQNVELLELYRSKIADGDLIKAETFIKLLPLEYHNYVTDLITQRYVISEGWKKHRIIVENEYVLSYALNKTINQLKLGIVMKMLSDGKERIRHAVEEVEIANLLETQNQIDKTKNFISSILGRVILQMPEKSN